MSDLVKIVECPRDAWQGLPVKMAAEVKADYLRALVAAGFRHIDAVSFVSAAAVPQMADSERVLELLDLANIQSEKQVLRDAQDDNSKKEDIQDEKQVASSSSGQALRSAQDDKFKQRGIQGEKQVLRSAHDDNSKKQAADDKSNVDDVEIIAIVVNAKGAERAVKAEAVSTLGFPYSISPGFLQRNQNQTPEESLEALEAVGTIAYKAGLEVVAYISMAFGNPYGDAWDIEEVVAACDLLVDSGVRQISLADTVGLATPKQVGDVVAAVMGIHDKVEFGVHLHARYDEAAERIRAAYGAGCRRFDAAIGGLGGCPFAQDALVGNIATEKLIEVLKELGAEMERIGPLDGLIAASEEISRKFGARVQ